MPLAAKMLLDRVSLTQSGRPSLLPGEVEQSALDSVDFCFEGGGGLPHDQASEYTVRPGRRTLRSAVVQMVALLSSFKPPLPSPFPSSTPHAGATFI